MSKFQLPNMKSQLPNMTPWTAVAAALSATFAALPSAHADEPGTDPSTPAPSASAEEQDSVRFRGGVSAAGGALAVAGFSVGLGGVDGRLGVQINDYVGIFATPHLALGGGTHNDVSVFTGVAAAGLVAEGTLFDRAFLGLGGGAGYIGSLPSAYPHLHVRAGGYPVVGDEESGGRRTGLSVGLDLRVHFVLDSMVVQPMGTIGYEAF